MNPHQSLDRSSQENADEVILTLPNFKTTLNSSCTNLCNEHCGIEKGLNVEISWRNSSEKNIQTYRHSACQILVKIYCIHELLPIDTLRTYSFMLYGQEISPRNVDLNFIFGSFYAHKHTHIHTYKNIFIQGLRESIELFTYLYVPMYLFL